MDAPHTQRGFTLIETMVVVVIAAILAAVAAPAMRTFIVGARVKSAALDTYSALAYARSEAIAKNAAVTITAVGGDWAAGWEIARGATVLRRQGAFSSVSVAGPEAGTITYQPDGRIDVGGNVSLDFFVGANPEINRRCVRVGTGGRPTLQTDSDFDGDCANG